MNDDGINWMTVRLTVEVDVQVIADNDEEALREAVYSDEGRALSQFDYGMEIVAR